MQPLLAEAPGLFEHVYDAGVRMIETAALYVRVSTLEQDLEGQERELLDYARSRGWLVGPIYREKVSATGRVHREEFDRLNSDAAWPDRAWTRVLVWSLDRWSRDASFVRTVSSIERLEALGIRFHSLRDPSLDTDADPLTRQILRGLLPTLASFEAQRRSERTRIAMQELKSGRRRTRTGRPVGRPRRLTPELEARIRELRWPLVGKPRQWKEIARVVHLPAGTCSKVPRAPPSGTPRSEKGPVRFGERGGGKAVVIPPAVQS